MTTLLSQIVAVEKTVKTEAFATLTGAHHQVQRAPLLAGIARSYRPLHEEGEQLPPESTRVQLRAIEAMSEVRRALSRLFDVTATRDWANCSARASITIGQHTLLTDVPVPYLLFLEKQLKALQTFLEKLPVLDPAEEWQWDQDRGAWRTPAYETFKSKKVPRNHVLAEATPQHKAQVEMYYEDVPVGVWSTVKFSGALPAAHVKTLVERVQTLRDATKFARERANATEVNQIRVAPAIFDYLFNATPPASEQAAAA